ncbi:UNVERIFIED_CONTAM: Interactor of constitutive active ROPs 3 [Sesamum radiatum]|uniref:Interactor of constitutive active ROPs 3 n=1 Tax=Sesamum radiatum TaxID=300843 RepID=A0AAW2I7A9_SESRA
MKLGSLTDEADKSCKKAARVSEQLDAAQAANSEMEAELRRLKVQSDQWRKAAEAAAAILSSDTDDESPKKRNGNMLKKIGVLLKKGQK